ncbi:MAG: hypothetical protein KAI66_15555, partial [Lentisphaeria bacterium]|nr:hypothetical protein [Lentisphaeria bacterium]
MMRKIECAGSPTEMGRQYGEQAREEIRHNLLLWNVAERLAKAPGFAESADIGLQRHAPALRQELQGIAAGADIPYGQILLCNHYNPGGPTVGCTPMALAESADGPIAAKNNDAPPGERFHFLVHESCPDDGGIPVLQVTYAGWLSGLDACNAEGVATVHGSVGSVFERTGPRIDIRPWSFLALRQTRSTAEFLTELNAAPLTGKGFNVIVADRAGDTAVLEAAVPVLAVRGRSERFVYATNHFHTESLLQADRRTPQGKRISTARYEYLEWVAQTTPPNSADDLKHLLSAHEPWSPCRHGGAHVSSTLWSMIALPTTGELLVSDGP